jgi:glycosyltransferase involved in cell wall biosynthesis
MDPLDICFVSTYPPTHCGLATFSSSLRAAMTSNGIARTAGVVRVVEEPEPPRRPEVVAEWHWGDRASRDQALRALADYDVAIVQHEYGIYPGDDGLEVVGFLRGSPIPTIVVLHTVLSDPTPHQRLVIEQVMEAADLLVTMTDAARRRLVDVHAVTPERIAVVPHGAPLNLDGSRILRRREPVVLTWGLIGPGKGLEYGIEAMRFLDDLDPAPVYVIGGQTHPKVAHRYGERYRDGLLKQAVDDGVAEHVVFEDRYLDAGALRALVRSADVVLLPYESREQISSGVLVEAIAAGKPVVATAFPHAIELLASACGIVVPHQDPESIAKALRRLLTDEGLSTSMRSQAQLEAERLAWPAVGQEYARLIRRVLAEREAA